MKTPKAVGDGRRNTPVGAGEPAAPLLSRGFLLLLLTGMLGMSTLNLVLPILPLVIARSGDRAAAGVVTAVIAAFTILLELRTAAILRRVAEKRLLVIALLLQAAAMAGFLTVHGLPAMLVSGALAGAGFGTVATVTASAAGSLAPPGRHGEAIGYYGMAASMPTIVCPPAALLLVTAFGAAAVFATAAAACLVGALVATRLPDKPLHELDVAGRGALATLRRWPVLSVWLAFVCVTFTYGAVVSFTPFLLGATGWGSAAVFLFVFGVARLLTRVGSGRFIDRIGARRLVLPSLVAGGLALALLPLGSAWLVVLSAAAYGGAFGIVQTGAFVEMLQASGSRSTAGISGLWNMGVDAGFGTGALVLAPVAVLIGYPLMFWLLPALFALALVTRLASGSRTFKR